MFPALRFILVLNFVLLIASSTQVSSVSAVTAVTYDIPRLRPKPPSRGMSSRRFRPLNHHQTHAYLSSPSAFDAVVPFAEEENVAGQETRIHETARGKERVISDQRFLLLVFLALLFSCSPLLCKSSASRMSRGQRAGRCVQAIRSHGLAYPLSEESRAGSRFEALFLLRARKTGRVCLAANVNRTSCHILPCIPEQQTLVVKAKAVANDTIRDKVSEGFLPRFRTQKHEDIAQSCPAHSSACVCLCMCVFVGMKREEDRLMDSKRIREANE